MTEYEEKMFNNLSTLQLGRWTNIKQDRPDLEEFKNVIKKRIDEMGDFLFSDDYTKFIRILPFSSRLFEFNQTHDFIPEIIAYHITRTPKKKEYNNY